MSDKAETKTKETMTEDKPKRVRHSYLFAVGRRKKAVARVRLFKKGTGKITVNDKPSDEYFKTMVQRQDVKDPVVKVGMDKDLDFSVKVAGGGPKGQAEAVRHGIARALVVLDKDLQATLKPEGFLKRDPRRKERKKPGLKRARRAPQFSKR